MSEKIKIPDLELELNQSPLLMFPAWPNHTSLAVGTYVPLIIARGRQLWYNQQQTEGGSDIGQAGIGWVVMRYRYDLVKPRSFQIKNK